MKRAIEEELRVCGAKLEWALRVLNETRKQIEKLEEQVYVSASDIS